MVNHLNLMSIFRIFSLLLCFVFFNNCSGANFGGDGNDERVAASQPNGNGLDPVDNPPPIEPAPGSEDYLVYQTRLLDYDLSLDDEAVAINITPQSQEILLFIHTHSPIVITLTGDTDAIAGLFITANSALSTSTAKLADGTPFPASITATGFFPNYSTGSGLLDVIELDDINAWNSGVAAETFAKNQGPNKCFYFDYDSAVDPAMSFTLSWSSGLTCGL